MKFRIFLISFLFVVAFPLFAQQGDLFIYTYPTPISNADNHNVAALQGNEGVMYFANSKGVISYNGVQWEMINTNTTPYSLAVDTAQGGKIYVGCSSNFGYLLTDLKGKTKYISISEKGKNFGEISKIILLGSKVYFYSSQIIFQYSKSLQKIEKVWFAPKENPYTGIFTFQQAVFVNLAGKGLHIIKNQELVAYPNGDFLAEDLINTSIESDEENILLGTSENNLYLFDGTTIRDYPIEAQKYLEESTLKGGLSLSKDEFVLYTLSGGCIIINKQSGKTRQTINYQSGLSDDEVLSVCTDNYLGLWICNEYGISRVDVNLPVLNFSDYPGLEGNITTLIKLDTILYTATNEGLYYLAKVDKLDQLIKLVKQEQKEYTVLERNVQTTIRADKQIAKSNLNTSEAEKTENEKKKKRKEKREQRRNERKAKKQGNETQVSEDGDKNTAINQVKNEPKDTLVVIKEAPTKKFTVTKTTTEYQDNIYALQSFPFAYTKVSGLRAKCKQMVVFKNKILAATQIGLYEINNKSAKPIIKNIYINFICRSNLDSNRFYVGTNEGLLSIVYKQNYWAVTNNLSNLGQGIHSIAEINRTLWLGGESLVFQIFLDEEGNPVKSEKFTLPNNYKENVIVRIIDGKAVFFLSNGIYNYNATKKSLNIDITLMPYFNPRSSVLFNQADFVWIKPEDSYWRNIQHLSRADSLQTAFLSIFKEIQDIYVDDDKNIWVVSDKLYKIDANARLDFGKSFEILIKSIRGKRGELLPFENISLDYNKSALKIQLASAFYLREVDIQYQYRLEGLDDEWTNWDKQSTLSFPFLPSGTYKLHVRAKNIFGQKSLKKIISFRVNPPFWQTWWFYTVSALLLAALIYGIIRLRTRALKTANLRLEYKVSEKTKEVVAQKKQLEVAFGEISTQKVQIEITNLQLKEANSNLEEKVEERTAKLRTTLVKLLQSNKELDTFIYRSSHDLKSPITRLLGLANLAKMDAKEEEVIQNLSYIELTAQNMISMLDKLNQVHSITRELFDFSDFDIAEMFEKIKRNLKNNIGFESVNFIVKLESEPVVHSDETLIKIILENLLENAVNFKKTEEDVYPIIKFIFRQDEQFLYFKVLDNGVGIPEEHKGRIFDMFYRASTKSKGNGLGLYLTKKAIEKLKGEITFESEPDKLTTFSVRLPVFVKK